MELRKVGADIRVIVCDQVAIIKSYLNKKIKKKKKFLKVCPEKPYFILDSVKIFATFDWPHLIKRLIAQHTKSSRLHVHR